MRPVQGERERERDCAFPCVGIYTMSSTHEHVILRYAMCEIARI